MIQCDSPVISRTWGLWVGLNEYYEFWLRTAIIPPLYINITCTRCAVPVRVTESESGSPCVTVTVSVTHSVQCHCQSLTDCHCECEWVILIVIHYMIHTHTHSDTVGVTDWVRLTRRFRVSGWLSHWLDCDPLTSSSRVRLSQSMSVQSLNLNV